MATTSATNRTIGETIDETTAATSVPARTSTMRTRLRGASVRERTRPRPRGSRGRPVNQMKSRAPRLDEMYCSLSKRTGAFYRGGRCVPRE